ncbi:MAG TPA: hypothetical protein VM118_05220 [Acidobacteriota bacterium]|nr:hypothetical protein [Acidobacteriota bacterium]
MRATTALVAVALLCATAIPAWADSTAVPSVAPASFPPTPSPVTLLPGFALISGWEEAQRGGASALSPAWVPAARAAAAFCRYYGLPFETDRVRQANLSPLEWPHVFADERVTARRQRADTEALLAVCGLAFYPVVTLDTREATDSILMVLAAGLPVLFNTPGTQIVYGYDRREPDQWWWMQGPDGAEIVYESERSARYVFWDDDPVANLFWVVTGPAPSASPSGSPRDADNRLLRTVSQSVAGDPERGIEPYPLSMRRVIDRLDASDTLPALAHPIDSLDPIGAGRVLNARLRLTQSLERLVPMATDSALSAPLRLAQYFYHNSTGALEELRDVFYADPNGLGRPAALRANWTDRSRRAEAARLLQDALRWERDALTEVNRALAAHDHLKSD